MSLRCSPGALISANLLHMPSSGQITSPENSQHQYDYQQWNRPLSGTSAKQPFWNADSIMGLSNCGHRGISCNFHTKCKWWEARLFWLVFRMDTYGEVTKNLHRCTQWCGNSSQILVANSSFHLPHASPPAFSFSDHCITTYPMVQTRNLQIGFFSTLPKIQS